MRVALAAELLAAPAAEVVELLGAWIEEMAGRPSGSSATALDSVCVALTLQRIGYSQKAALYAEARKAKHDEIALLFFEVERNQSSKLRTLAANQRPLSPNTRPLALGERKFLARTNDRRVLNQLLADPHPSVVERLIKNPHITEHDTLVMASKRPALPESLVAIYLSNRWRPRHSIRRTLALNPHTPIGVAARITLTLPVKDLRDFARNPSLGCELCLQAKRLLERWQELPRKKSA